MNFKSMITYFLNPSVKDRIDLHIKKSEKELFDNIDLAEHYKSLVQYHTQRLERLRAMQKETE